MALTLLQIFISRATVEKDEGYIYVTVRDLIKGESIKSEDIEKIKIYGYTMEIQVSDNLICIFDMPKGSIVTKQSLIEKHNSNNQNFVSIATDKNRCALKNLSINTKIDLFIMPDIKSLSLYESSWLERLLIEESIAYDPDKDIGFVINGLTVSSISGLDTANQNIVLEVEPPIDRLLAFMKNKCVMEFIIPMQ